MKVVFMVVVVVVAMITGRVNGTEVTSAQLLLYVFLKMSWIRTAHGEATTSFVSSVLTEITRE